jgi:hypothetical protein
MEGTPPIALCHLGYNCAPGIVIDDIIGTRQKQLFQLGTYRIKDIATYLSECSRDPGAYKSIYDKASLRVVSDAHVVHTKYNFGFNHDYRAKDGHITNYEHIVDRFNTKIDNFRRMLDDDKNVCVFITFLAAGKDVSHIPGDIDKVDGASGIGELADWLSCNKKGSFHWVIFADAPYTTELPACCSVVVLQNSYYRWYSMQADTKRPLYDEIHRKLIACLESRGIDHGLPRAKSAP